MASAFETALAVARDSIQNVAGVVITYKRGADSVTINDAVPGQTPVEMLDDLGFVSESLRYTDWLIDPADLVLNSATIEPEKGDEIRREINGKTHVYRVTQLTGAEIWRYSDNNETRIRVHTFLKDDDE